MKNVLMASLVLLSMNAFAAPTYYQPEFSISKVSRLCPPPKPGQMSCQAIGAKVTISATLGCLDKLVFHEVKTLTNGDKLEIHSVAIALLNEESDKVMCFRANTVEKTIMINSNGENVVLINDLIQL